MRQITRRSAVLGGIAALAALAGASTTVRADDEAAHPTFVMFHVEAGW